MLKLFAGFLLVAFPAYTNAVTNIVLTNDDGWAVAQIRSEFTGLTNAGYAVSWNCFPSGGLNVCSYCLLQVVLSAPAEDESGTGSDSAPPTVLTKPCEFNTCPTGSPPEGHDASNSKLLNLSFDCNYPIWTLFSFSQLCEFISVRYATILLLLLIPDEVISVDSVRYGIQTLSPQLLGGPPNLIFSGVNVGSKLISLHLHHVIYLGQAIWERPSTSPVLCMS